MQAMINSALEFFRDDARLEHATAFDLAELLHTIVDDLKDAGTEVAFEGAQRLVYVGRPIGIKRALVNLIDNAIKYGGAPTVRLEANANRVDIRILDRGPGIAAQYLEQVFTPFFRIEGSRNKHTGGVGLEPVGGPSDGAGAWRHADPEESTQWRVGGQGLATA